MKVVYGMAAAAALAVATLVPQAAMADRVCHEECSAGVCRQECITTEDRVERHEDRVERRERYEERRDDRPGVDIRVPGVEVDVGR